MPENIDRAAFQRRARRNADLDALLGVVGVAVTLALVLWLRNRCVSALAATLLTVLAALDAASIVAIFVVRRQRLNEIAGGEEYEARKY